MPGVVQLRNTPRVTSQVPGYAMLGIEERTTMRFIRTAAASVAMAATAVVAQGTFGASVQAASPAYLFAVQAVNGSTSTVSAAKGENERFTLTLRGVDPVTKFADRPFRSASVMSPTALVSNWSAWFASSPPNAVLTYTGAAGAAPQSIVVTLTRPRYEKDGRSLTFTATRTYRSLDPLNKGTNWVRPATPRTFVGASLFIDDAGSSTTDSLTAAMQQAMQAYVFAPNDGQTWSAVQSALSGILTTAWQQGILMGPTASQAFTVSCQMTSAQQVLNGYLDCSVSMQLAGGTNFSTTLTQSMQASG